MAETNPIPEGFHTVTPSVTVKGGRRFIDFLKRAFGAEELSNMDWPQGGVMHATVRIGDSIIMLADAQGDMKAEPVTLSLYVEDSDKMYKKALGAGGKEEPRMEFGDQFWGDRGGTIIDPFGNRWWIPTHKEDLSPQEVRQRADAFMAQQAKKMTEA